jgi:hypothetical protein
VSTGGINYSASGMLGFKNTFISIPQTAAQRNFSLHRPFPRGDEKLLGQSIAPDSH